jgi:hypothetical protein
MAHGGVVLVRTALEKEKHHGDLGYHRKDARVELQLRWPGRKKERRR